MGQKYFMDETVKNFPYMMEGTKQESNKLRKPQAIQV